MAFPFTTWRLIRSDPARGAWNMAVDEAILEVSGRGHVLPTLRLYAWEPPCLSLGYAQSVSDVRLSELEWQGWDLVRRPTGGRAILHTDELTYSVIGPQNEPRLVGGVLESYRVLATALLRALQILEIPAQANEKPPVGSGDVTAIPALNQVSQLNPNPVCFEVPSNYEITVQGKKLIGSAQARRKEGVLQHGSLPLCGDLSRIVQALSFQDAAARAQAADRLLARAATAEHILGWPVTWEQAAQAFTQAFAQELHIKLEPAELTAWELQRADALLAEKYGNPAWTARL